MKPTILFAVLGMLLVGSAAAGPPETINGEILARAKAAEAGVIVAVTGRGEVAAETAWLLSAQVQRDPRYAPYLLVPTPEQHAALLQSLRLSDAALPALIFYDRKGREISRVVGALPSRLIKQARSGDNRLN